MKNIGQLGRWRAKSGVHHPESTAAQRPPVASVAAENYSANPLDHPLEPSFSVGYGQMRGLATGLTAESDNDRV